MLGLGTEATDTLLVIFIASLEGGKGREKESRRRQDFQISFSIKG